MNPRGQQFLDALATRILVGDSAMGSRLYELGASPSVSYDYLNIAQPDLVRQVHLENLVGRRRPHRDQHLLRQPLQARPLRPRFPGCPD